MLIRVYVTPNAREVTVFKITENYFEVRVDERAVGNRANKRLVEILSDYFNIPKSRITILEGTRTRDKTIQITSESTAS